MSLEDMERELLSRDTKTAKILRHFKNHSEDIITVDDLLEAIDVQYSTVWGTICRLNKMGLIEKKGRGRYTYPSEKLKGRFATLEDIDKGQSIEITAEVEIASGDEAKDVVNQDLNKKLKIFKNEEEKESIRLNVLKDIWWISNHYSIAHNDEILSLIKNLPNQNKTIQNQLISILSKILFYEDSSKGDKKLKEKIVKKCSEMVKTLILSDKTDTNIRISAMSILTDQIGGREATDILLKIVKSDDTTWNNLGGSHVDIIGKIAKDKIEHRKYFLEKLIELLRDDNSTIVARAEKLYDFIRRHHYLKFHCPEIADVEYEEF